MSDQCSTQHKTTDKTHCSDDIDRKIKRQRDQRSFDRHLLSFGLLLLLILGGCTAEDRFKQGRLVDPCNSSFATCRMSATAGCYLNNSNYIERQFPDAHRFLVGTIRVNEVIRVRVFFKNMFYPGTEILAQAYEPDCGNITEDSRDYREGVDVFEEAGDDQIMMFDLTVETPGDHLVELYSDCAADILVTAEPLQNE